MIQEGGQIMGDVQVIAAGGAQAPAQAPAQAEPQKRPDRSEAQSG